MFTRMLLGVLIYFGSFSTAYAEQCINDEQSSTNPNFSRVCDELSAPKIFDYRFDENSWTGRSGEVFDQEEAYNGRSKNGANTSQLSPAMPTINNLGTCGYGVFDGVNDYVALPGNFGNQQGSFTITAWINPSNLDAHSRIFIDDQDNNQAGYGFSLSDGKEGELRFYSRGVDPVPVDTINANIRANQWTFVAAVHNSTNKTREIYVNGVAQRLTGGGLSHKYTGNWGVDNGIASIGGETNSGETNNRFKGAIDEVRMYNGALTGDEIASIQSAIHPCINTVDHFEIIHDGQGLTCEAENITIKACSDALCSSLYEDEIDVQLLVNGNIDTTLIVAGGRSDIKFSYMDDLIPATLSLRENYTCQNGTSNSCDVIFSDAGFIIGNNSNTAPVIPVQLSGKPSNIGFKSESLFLQAVRKDDNTGSCVGVFPENTDVSVNLSYTCHADSSTCTNNLTLTNNSNDISLTTSTVEHGLHFTDDSKAYFSIEYPDAGKIIINAQKDVELENSEGDKVIKDFSVSSNAFVVRPFGFQLDFSQDDNKDNALALTAESSAFKKAGETFKLTATAKQWKSNQDIDNDGIPDDFADISVNDIAGNFENEALKVSRELFLPDPVTANLGILTQETTASFTASELTNSYNFSEVGIIHLSAKLDDGDYLGGGDIQGYIANVGRFTPAYFTQTVQSHGSLGAKHHSSLNACDSLCVSQNWVYSGQKTEDVGSLTYEFAPEIIITAHNESDGIAENYTYADFMKLSSSDIKISLPTEDFEKNRLTPDVVGEKVLITSVMTLGSSLVVNNSGTSNIGSSVERSGELLYEFNEADHFIYEHNLHSKYAPFPAKIPFTISDIKDSDSISLYKNSGSSANASISATEQVVIKGVEVRFGRWNIENSFGPETSSLVVPMAIQYWNGDKFEINMDDNFTIPDINGAVNNGEIWSGGLSEWQYRLLDTSTHSNEPVKPTDVVEVIASDPLTTFINGEYRKFIINPLETGKVGSLNIEYEVPSWLKYDWNSDENFEENPSAILTFGLFRGNDRIISQREIYE